MAREPRLSGRELASAEPPAPRPLDELYRLYYLGLVRLAVQFVDNQAAAEDLVQDVFAKLSRPGRDTTITNERAYLYTAVVNAARSTLRRHAVRRRMFAPGSVGAAAADESSMLAADRRRVLAVIRRLPTRQREVVVLRYYEDFSIAEIAQLLDISARAVSSSLNRALNTLRPRMREDNDG